MDYSLGNIWYLLLLLLVPVLGMMMVAFLRWRKKKQKQFADPRFSKDLFSEDKRFTAYMPILYLLAVVFLIFSIVDVLGGSEKVESQQKINNVLFVLDVSNSMNAEDIEPSRLQMAKNIMLTSMEKFSSERVGIVVFAGEARSIMPLTTDLTAAQTYISGIETSIIKTQGTDFLKAMQEAVKKFKTVSPGARDVVLISDGEDNEGNDRAAMNLAKKEGIRVHTIGIGTTEGAPVPEYLYGQLMGYKLTRNGQTVVSSRQENALKSLAQGTSASYIDGNSLEQSADQLITSLKKHSASSNILVESSNAKRYYQYFLLVSIAFFAIIYLFNPKKDFNL